MVRLTAALCAFIVVIVAGCGSMNENNQRPVSVVVVTGGHDFDRQPFVQMFDQMPQVKWQLFELKDDSELFEDISNWDYDVIIFYNMTQNISPKRKAHFRALMDRGVGVVALHHSIISFQDWPEYKEIIGGRYYLQDTLEDGTVWPAGTYKHDVQMHVKIVDKRHPVTAGLQDFAIVDETYKGYAVEPDNHVLLTVNEPTSEQAVAWARVYRHSRVCTIQLGHGPDAFNHPAYRQLLLQAIRWTARNKD